MAQPDLPSALWLVRHGESEGNLARARAHAVEGERLEIGAARDMDVSLSALGERQAAALGRWIARLPAEEKPGVVLASPLPAIRR